MTKNQTLKLFTLTCLALLAITLAGCAEVKSLPIIEPKNMTDLNHAEEVVLTALKADLREDLKQSTDSTKLKYIVSTKNLEKLKLPKKFELKLANYKNRQIEIQYLNLTEIQTKANQEGDFMFRSFSEINITKPKATLTVARSWAVSESSNTTYLSGGVRWIELEMIRGNWQAAIARGVIS